MVTVLAVAFLVVHGFVHLPVWATPQKPDEPGPFDPAHSWLLSASYVPRATMRTLSVLLAVATGLLFIIAGAAVAAGSAWWETAALTAALCGLVLKAGWFNPWLSLGVLLDAAVVAAVLLQWPASLY